MDFNSECDACSNLDVDYVTLGDCTEMEMNPTTTSGLSLDGEGEGESVIVENLYCN